MLSQADVLIEPFRPGVMEKLGLGPSVIMALNPRIIYARLTGFGQDGIHSKMAGHDINYLALSGALSIFGRKGENPIFPGNVLADFAAGGLMCALGIALAIIERNQSGKGQVIDNAMVDGVSYLSTFIFKAKGIGGTIDSTTGSYLWDKERGDNLLDSGCPFYEVYKTKDGKFISVGALEPQFYLALVNILGLENNPTFAFQMDRLKWPLMKRRFAEIFLTKTRDEWTKIFHESDACVLPVLEMEEMKLSDHAKQTRPKMVSCFEGGIDPAPSPILSRTPATIEGKRMPFCGQHTIDILEEFGFEKSAIQGFLKEGVVQTHQNSPLKSSL
eukprot:TRINITY_DN1228_c0_g1_i6.p1 TRINITY_DN1228_c0_g1~~TRINITY_DN1228_c0_g1_i6.p1  ORF type:complete len:330 (+),score=47.34 TRINITY_DN1228_c0_g1_i6:285-1274(+)